MLREENRSAAGEGVCDGWQTALKMYPVFSANHAGGGGINSLPPPIRPPLTPNVFNAVEEVEE
ncbi:MAG TPA: hypothetical protein VI636_13365 [Candidatus Angelobacter sp.]